MENSTLLQRDHLPFSTSNCTWVRWRLCAKIYRGSWQGSTRDPLRRCEPGWRKDHIFWGTAFWRAKFLGYTGHALNWCSQTSTILFFHGTQLLAAQKLGSCRGRGVCQRDGGGGPEWVWIHVWINGRSSSGLGSTWM